MSYTTNTKRQRKMSLQKVSKYRLGMYEKSKDKVDTFIGKYAFGKNTEKIDIPPLVEKVPSTIRYNAFIQGKLIAPT